jgi:hypothetical protein
MEVDDLFTDLADGKKLLKLLEIISGERLAKPNNGRMRVHKIENVNKSLAFLHTKVIPRSREHDSPLSFFSLVLPRPPLTVSLFRGLEYVFPRTRCSLSKKASRETAAEIQQPASSGGGKGRRANKFVRGEINEEPGKAEPSKSG